MGLEAPAVLTSGGSTLDRITARTNCALRFYCTTGEGVGLISDAEGILCNQAKSWIPNKL